MLSAIWGDPKDAEDVAASAGVVAAYEARAQRLGSHVNEWLETNGFLP